MNGVLEDPRPIRLSLEPLDDFVVIEPTDEESETRAGLIVPASAETQCLSGIVTAVTTAGAYSVRSSHAISAKPCAMTQAT